MQSDVIVDASSGQQWTSDDLPIGLFNHHNACAALLAARHAGVPFDVGIDALRRFSGVKRRQEVIAEIDGITVIDDFAHHPTAISATLEALQTNCTKRLCAVFEPRSNTMKAGVHGERLKDAFNAADGVVFYDNGQLAWDPNSLADPDSERIRIRNDVDQIVGLLVAEAAPGDTIVIMSNGSFDGLRSKLVSALTNRHYA